MVEITPYSECYDELWQRGNLSYKLDSLQRTIRDTINATTYDKVLNLSSRQIGKSYLAAVLATEFCIQNPDSIVRLLSPTLKQTNDIIQDNLNKIVLDAPKDMYEQQRSSYRWRIGKSSLRLGSLERSHVDSNRGGNADLLILEEDGFLNSDDCKYANDSVLGPQLLRSGGREIHITTPSEDEFHYVHDEVMPLCEKNGTLFRYTVYDSPSITPTQIEKAIERCGGIDTEAFQREYLARIIRSTSLSVIPEFREDSHVAHIESPSHFTHVISYDLGGSLDFTGCVLLIYDFQRNIIIVADEFFMPPNTGTEEIVGRGLGLEAKYKLSKPYRTMDATGQIHIDLAQKFGYPCILPNKQDRLAGIQALRKRFSDNSIVIAPHCVNLIRALKMGRWSDTKRDDFSRNSTIGHCDMLAALIYGNRMLDTWTNPFPAMQLNRDTQMQVHYRSKPSGLKNLADTLSPYNPMGRRS